MSDKAQTNEPPTFNEQLIEALKDGEVMDEIEKALLKRLRGASKLRRVVINRTWKDMPVEDEE
jgi:uncharacterized protein YutE (UPF0331/DUF86 family)